MKREHIVLIQTCNPSLITDKYADKYPYPPIGLQYLLGFLKMNGYDVTIIDFYLKSINKNDFEQIILNMEKPVLFGISSYTDSINQTYKVAESIKSIYKDVPIVLGGAHATFMYNDIMKECSAIDYISLGEGESSLVPLLEYIRFQSFDISNIPNLVYRNKNGIVTVTQSISYVTNLDISPLLWYPEEMKEFIRKDARLIFVSSRGCPGGCIFCASRAFSGSQYRAHSAEWIISLLYFYDQEIGFYMFGPLDDTFTVNRKRLKKFIAYMNQLNYTFPWSCKSRVDVIDSELADILKNSHCMSVHIGVESGDDNILKAINKKINLTQVFNAIELLACRGIRTECSFIIGHPFDTLETIEKTLILAEMLNQSDHSMSVLGICTPFPGTDLYINKDKYEMNIKVKNWKKYDLGTPIFETKNFNSDDLKKAYYYHNYGFKNEGIHSIFTQNTHQDLINKVELLFKNIKGGTSV